jgi:DNA-binding CsgD family transcriptional regulator
LEGLTQREARSVLDALQELAAARDLATFCARAAAVLPRLVPCELGTYNDLDLESRSVAWTVNESDRLFPGAIEIFQGCLHENPYLPYRRRTRDAGVVRLSDLVSERRFRATGLYNEFYRPLRLHHSMAGALWLDRRKLVALAVYRGRPDFSERERRCLAAVRSHLTQVYRSVQLLTELGGAIALLEQGVDALDRGLIVVSPGGRIRVATALARAWLGRYFPGQLGSDELPETLCRWLRHSTSPQGVPTPASASMVVERGDARLLVRVAAGATGRVLLLEERVTRYGRAALRHLGLSSRESEVLALVAEGLTNPATAACLGCSPRTVQTHLEHIYRKLGVSTRAAAAASVTGSRFF